MAHTQVSLSQLLIQLSSAYENSPFWTATEATYALNEALLMWNLLTQMWAKRITLPTTASGVYYNLPSIIVQGARVEWNEHILKRATLWEMDAARPSWENQTIHTGGSVPSRPTYWVPVGLTTIAIWPADTVAANALSIDGVTSTPQLILSTDKINLGREEQGAIIAYALHVLSFKGDRTRWHGSVDLYKKFVFTAANKNKRLFNSALFRRFLSVDTQQDQNPTTR